MHLGVECVIYLMGIYLSLSPITFEYNATFAHSCGYLDVHYFLNFSCVQLGYVLVGVCVLPTQSSTPIITRYCNLSSQSLSMVILSLAHNIKVKWSFFTQE